MTLCSSATSWSGDSAYKLQVYQALNTVISGHADTAVHNPICRAAAQYKPIRTRVSNKMTTKWKSLQKRQRIIRIKQLMAPSVQQMGRRHYVFGLSVRLCVRAEALTGLPLISSLTNSATIDKIPNFETATKSRSFYHRRYPISSVSSHHIAILSRHAAVLITVGFCLILSRRWRGHASNSIYLIR